MLLLSNCSVFRGSIWKGFRYPGPALAGTEARCLILRTVAGTFRITFEIMECITFSSCLHGLKFCAATRKNCIISGLIGSFPPGKQWQQWVFVRFSVIFEGSVGRQLLIPAICEFRMELPKNKCVFGHAIRKSKTIQKCCNGLMAKGSEFCHPFLVRADWLAQPHLLKGYVVVMRGIRCLPSIALSQSLCLPK